MALQLGALREALIDAGASDEKAQKAAEEMAAYDREFADVRSDLKLLKWIQGATFAGVIAIALTLFVH